MHFAHKAIAHAIYATIATLFIAAMPVFADGNGSGNTSQCAGERLFEESDLGLAQGTKLQQGDTVNQEAVKTDQLGAMISAGGTPKVDDRTLMKDVKVKGMSEKDARGIAKSFIGGKNSWKGPLTPAAFEVILVKSLHRLASEENDPNNAGKPAQAAQQAQATDSANSCGEVARDQAASAIDFCAHYLTNFTVDGGNKWNLVRNAIFVPMGILLLLPGALLTQVRAIMAAGNPVLGNINPLEGIQRSVIAVFLIPSTYLVVNYSIDLSNSITFTINSEYFRLFGSDMYKDAICAEIRAFPVRDPQENRNALDLPEATMGALINPAGQFAQFEGMMLENKIEDPCSGLYLAPPGRADEAMSASSVAARLGLNGSNAMLTASWNILCAFQMAYLYYLWFVGPVVAGLWVWPMKQLRGALPSWVEGVVTLAFWALFWNTTILLIACFKGVGETGTILISALNFLATASVKHAFDFAGLVRAAGQEAANMAEKAMKSGGAGGGSGGGGSCGGGASQGASGGQSSGAAAGAVAASGQGAGAGAVASSGHGQSHGGLSGTRSAMDDKNPMQLASFHGADHKGGLAGQMKDAQMANLRKNDETNDKSNTNVGIGKDPASPGTPLVDVSAPPLESNDKDRSDLNLLAMDANALGALPPMSGTDGADGTTDNGSDQESPQYEQAEAEAQGAGPTQQQLLAQAQQEREQLQQDEEKEKAYAEEQAKLAATLLTLQSDGTQTANDQSARSSDGSQLRSFGANFNSSDVTRSAHVQGGSGHSGTPDAGSVLVSTTASSMPPMTAESIANLNRANSPDYSTFVDATIIPASDLHHNSLSNSTVNANAAYVAQYNSRDALSETSEADWINAADIGSVESYAPNEVAMVDIQNAAAQNYAAPATGSIDTYAPVQTTQTANADVAYLGRDANGAAVVNAQPIDPSTGYSAIAATTPAIVASDMGGYTAPSDAAYYQNVNATANNYSPASSDYSVAGTSSPQYYASSSNDYSIAAMSSALNYVNASNEYSAPAQSTQYYSSQPSDSVPAPVTQNYSRLASDAVTTQASQYYAGQSNDYSAPAQSAQYYAAHFSDSAPAQPTQQYYANQSNAYSAPAQPTQYYASQSNDYAAPAQPTQASAISDYAPSAQYVSSSAQSNDAPVAVDYSTSSNQYVSSSENQSVYWRTDDFDGSRVNQTEHHPRVEIQPDQPRYSNESAYASQTYNVSNAPDAHAHATVDNQFIPAIAFAPQTRTPAPARVTQIYFPDDHVHPKMQQANSLLNKMNNIISNFDAPASAKSGSARPADSSAQPVPAVVPTAPVPVANNQTRKTLSDLMPVQRAARKHQVQSKESLLADAWFSEEQLHAINSGTNV